MGLVRLAILATVGATMAGLCGRSLWLFELFSHFTPLYFLLLTGAALILIWKRRNFFLAWWLLLIPALGWNGFQVAQQWFPAPPQILHETTHLRVLFGNVLAGKRVSREILNFIAFEDPDVFALAEVGPHYAQELQRFEADYPYQMTKYRTDTYGLAVFSKWPLESQQVLFLDDRVPTFSARLQLETQQPLLIVTHPPPPITPALAGDRNRHFEKIVELLQSENQAVLLGDFNATVWSPRFQDFLGSAELRHARQGFGLLGTWSPRRVPTPRLPIDHILIHGPIAVKDFRLGPKDRSDHLPILADLEVGTPAK